MTEQEIVQYLKDNMEKGIVFNFMPEDVRIWCLSSINYRKLLQFNGDSWDSTDDVFAGHKVDRTKVFSLPEIFKVEEKSKCGWTDFDIDENGCYRILDTDMRFHWSEWNHPLWTYDKDENRSWYLTSFGGWKYKNDARWYMAPVVRNINDNQYWNSYIDNKKFINNCIPIKIRFWKEYK